MRTNSERDRLFAGLMRLAQNGDQVAYARLLSLLTPLAREIVRRRWNFVLRAEDIEDIVQDTLLSLHTARATYDPDRSFMAWFLAIVHNRATDGARRHYRRASNEIAVEHLPETFSPDVANIIEESYGDPEALRRAIGGLPPGQREAIELLKLRELSLKEASTASGMTVGALKVAVHRAIKSLRTVVRKET